MHPIGWLGIFLFFVGAGSLLWGWSQRSRSRAFVSAAQAWPTTAGIILSNDMVVQGGLNPNDVGVSDLLLGPRTRVPPTFFTPVVRYEYEAAGRKYVGTRIRAGGVQTGSKRAADKILKRYPVGSSVTVRYDPSDPKKCLLEITASSSPTMLMIIGALLMLMGGGFAAAAMLGNSSDKSDRSRRSRGDSNYESSRGRDTDRDRDRERERNRDRDGDRDRDRRSDR
jgi:hypothetical protein